MHLDLSDETYSSAEKSTTWYGKIETWSLSPVFPKAFRGRANTVYSSVVLQTPEICMTPFLFGCFLSFCYLLWHGKYYISTMYFFFNCLVVAELFCYCHNESSPAYMTFHIFLAPVKTCKRFPVSSWLQVVISGSMSLICGQGIKPCKSWGNKQQLIYLILYSWEWKLYLFSNSSAIIH